MFKKMEQWWGGGDSLRNGIWKRKSEFLLFEQRIRKGMNVFRQFKSLKCVNFEIYKNNSLEVCMSAVSGYVFRHALRYRVESWHGGRGRAHEVCGHIFEATPPGSKVIQKSICLKNTLWLPNFVRWTPDQSVVHCWGRRSCRGHLGSTS